MLAMASKKRKTSQNEEDEEKQSQMYVESILEDFKTFNGKEEFMDAMFEDVHILAGLQDSFYTLDHSTDAGLLYVPEDDTLTIERDSHGVVSKLTFRDNSKISGTSLRRLSIVLALKSTGYAGLVWEKDDNLKFAGLAFRPCNVCSGSDTVIENKNSSPFFTAYYQKSIKSNYIRETDLRTVLSIPEVGLCDMKALMCAMSQLKHVAPDTIFEVPSLDYAISLLKSPDIKRLTSTYATILIGVFVKHSSLDDRVKAFTSYGATAMLGQILSIPRPYSKALFGDDLTALNKKKVSELTEEDQVVCSNLPISAQFHQRVKATDEVPIKSDGPYGVKNGKKLLTNIETVLVPGNLVRSIVESIVKARKVPVYVGTSKKDEEDEEDDDVKI